MQLPAVKKQPIYGVPHASELSKLVTKSPAWEKLELFELTEIMRQKDDLKFIQALNNLAHGTVTQDDRDLLQTRVIKRKDMDKTVPKKCLRIFNTNKLVDDYNNECIRKNPGDLHQSMARDKIESAHLTKNQQGKLLQTF